MTRLRIHRLPRIGDGDTSGVIISDTEPPLMLWPAIATGSVSFTSMIDVSPALASM
ncbi:hypothetical protein PC116_g2087 [Phytophthora cactorum]|uniref:Uncharacterized protein n=1 Tax=Phytophthora cactorum TaxID=29920 RepID=A0A8T1EKT6_9STRA|nr:hypothetical protein PC114_g2638 [Phytophthora cactorum]KAG2954328.1 hypothetical protein PC117_g1334 [Phytophthora cactorum]KAG2994524.1 hypothetical protein PC119_g18250 [Phytophthora cactorum]KAG3200244.1 hypothetical protein PC128_g4688 [Phytophthora cactorum]KAG4250234.1 hypothetical protein PC116_g2087 [Phytophthora cactorum]